MTTMTDTAQAEPAQGTKGNKAGKAADAKKAEPRNIGHILPAQKSLAEAATNRWHCIAPKGAIPQDFDMESGPFQLVAADLTRFDDIRVVAAEGTWFADLVVVDAGPGFALCRVVQAINLPPRRSEQEARVPDGYQVVQGGPGEEPYVVRRLSDGVVLNFGCLHQTYEAALRYLLDHSTVRGQASPTHFGKPV